MTDRSDHHSHLHTYTNEHQQMPATVLSKQYIIDRHWSYTGIDWSSAASKMQNCQDVATGLLSVTFTHQGLQCSQFVSVLGHFPSMG